MSDIQTAREEIQAQRNALMVGTHVNRIPQEPGEGCLLVHKTQKGALDTFLRSTLSLRAIAWAAARLDHKVLDHQVHVWFDDQLAPGLVMLNDARPSYPGLTASQAIAILDEALLVLKDYEASLPSPKASTP